MPDRAHDIELRGCTPEPLMAYLKALGVLRLVAEQNDPAARGWWKDGVFFLRSGLDSDALVRFFLEEYSPTPVLAPWNAGSGFYKKWDRGKSIFRKREAADALDTLASSTASRLNAYRDQIHAVRKALVALSAPVDLPARLGSMTAKEADEYLKGAMFLELGSHVQEIPKTGKDAFLAAMRSEIATDEGIRWLDAALVIYTGRKKNRVEAPLLGSGGNIGNSDFSAKFMQLLSLVLPFQEGEPVTDESREWLTAALFATVVGGLKVASVDQFFPGRAGSANMGQGFEAAPLLNPWDYILMIEGALLMAGAATRRLGVNASVPSFPFTVEAVEKGSSCVPDDKVRFETWLPLWGKPASAAEISAILAEGRSQVGARAASSGLDFARAVTSFGVDRGVSSFVRYQFQKRLGDNYLATALEQMGVRERGEVALLREIDPWLDIFRRTVGDKNAPPRFPSALRRVNEAILDLCRYGGRMHLQSVLIALGKAERELALTAGRVGQRKTVVPPVSGLSVEWITRADDGSHEFAIARALASVHDADYTVGPLRANLEPVALGRRKDGRPHVNWIAAEQDAAKKHRAVVWNAVGLAKNLTAVLERRCMDGQRAGCENLPLASSVSVGLAAVGAFIDAEVDDTKIEDLLWGLTLVDDKVGGKSSRSPGMHGGPLSRAYALLKLLFLPQPIAVERWNDGAVRIRLARHGEQEVRVKPEPAVLQLLRAGRLGEACVIAVRRLRASGLSPLPRPIRGRRVRDDDWRDLQRTDAVAIHAQRLAASLLIPISSSAVTALRAIIASPEAADDVVASEVFEEDNRSVSLKEG